MKELNILYTPLILAFLIVYLLFFFTIGLFVGINTFDTIIKNIYKLLEEKIYFHIFCFIVNVYLWYLIFHFWLYEYILKLINSI